MGRNSEWKGEEVGSESLNSGQAFAQMRRFSSRLATLPFHLSSPGSRDKGQADWEKLAIEGGSQWLRRPLWLQLRVSVLQASGLPVQGGDSEEGQEETCVQEYP